MSNTTDATILEEKESLKDYIDGKLDAIWEADKEGLKDLVDDMIERDKNLNDRITKLEERINKLEK